MKNFLRKPKTYLLLLIIFVPVLMLTVFFSSYYSIYKDLINSSALDSTDAVRDPFENINSIEENNKDVKENENNELIEDGESNPLDEIMDNIDEPDSPDDPKKVSYNLIMGIYKGKFEKLKQSQEANLNSLMEQAKEEYIKNGSKKTSAVNLASRYLDSLKSIEKQSNKEFDILIRDLETELVENSHSTDVIQEIRDYYAYYKKTLKSKVLKKASEYL